MPKSVLAILIILVLAGCQIATPVPPRASVCPDGRWLIANIWSFKSLPAPIQKEVARMMVVAKSRDSRGATNPAAYRGDSVSRTMGALLRKEVKTRALVSLDLEVFLRYSRDPWEPKVAYEVGTLHVKEGTGAIRLPENPHRWIVEVVWPSDFISPIRSGGKNRMWILPEDWEGGKFCSMNAHGIVP